jgi:predicted DNA-binding transcriptional regulator AlpA
MSLEHSPPAHRRSFKINEWCEMRGYSRPYFYKLRNEGYAPEVIGEGKAQRITDAADARWVKRMEQKAKKARA